MTAKEELVEYIKNLTPEQLQRVLDHQAEIKEAFEKVRAQR